MVGTIQIGYGCPTPVHRNDVGNLCFGGEGFRPGSGIVFWRRWNFWRPAVYQTPGPARGPTRILRCGRHDAAEYRRTECRYTQPSNTWSGKTIRHSAQKNAMQTTASRSESTCQTRRIGGLLVFLWAPPSTVQDDNQQPDNYCLLIT